MTREEASIIVGNIPINGDGCYSIPEYQQAKAMAIQSLEADKKIVDVLYEIRNKITMFFIFDREGVVGIIDKYLKEVENG